MANCRGVAECWSQPNSKHSNVNVVRPSWPCESDARTYKLAPPDGGSGSAGSLNEGTLPGTYPGAAGARVRCSGHRARPCASATTNVRHAWLHCVPPLGKARMRRLDVGIRAVHARLGRFCGCVWRCAVCTRAS